MKLVRTNRESIFLLLLSLAIGVSGCSRRVTQSISQVETPHAVTSPSPDPTPAKPLQARPIENSWPKKYTFATKSIAENMGYELSAKYPQVVPAPTLELRRFNRWIKKRVLGHAARFRRIATAERRDKKRKRPPIEEGLELDFIVYYSDQKLISMRLTHRVMEAGQMHPINYYETINYDLKIGRSLRVHDLFRRGYLRAFSEYSRKYLADTYDLAPDDWMKRGTAPRSYNFPNWNVVPDGILLSFEDYQVNSHSFGQPEFVVPYSVLNRVLNRNSLANRFLRRRDKLAR